MSKAVDVEGSYEVWTQEQHSLVRCRVVLGPELPMGTKTGTMCDQTTEAEGQG